MPRGQIAEGVAFTAATKYGATHRPESLDWGPAEGLGADAGRVLASVLPLVQNSGATPRIVESATRRAPTLLPENPCPAGVFGVSDDSSPGSRFAPIGV